MLYKCMLHSSFKPLINLREQFQLRTVAYERYDIEIR